MQCGMSYMNPFDLHYHLLFLQHRKSSIETTCSHHNSSKAPKPSCCFHSICVQNICLDKLEFFTFTILPGMSSRESIDMSKSYTLVMQSFHQWRVWRAVGNGSENSNYYIQSIGFFLDAVGAPSRKMADSWWQDSHRIDLGKLMHCEASVAFNDFFSLMSKNKAFFLSWGH